MTPAMITSSIPSTRNLEAEGDDEWGGFLRVQYNWGG